MSPPSPSLPQASQGGSAADQLRAVFGHLGLPYVTDRAFRDVLDRASEPRGGGGLSLFRLLACDAFVKALEKDQEATRMVEEMGRDAGGLGGLGGGAAAFLEENLSFAHASFADAPAALAGPPPLVSASRAAADVIRAVQAMAELFSIFDSAGTGVVQAAEIEAVAEQAGELGSALVEEMYTGIDFDDDSKGEFRGVDRVAFFANFLHALGVVGEDAADAVRGCWSPLFALPRGSAKRRCFFAFSLLGAGCPQPSREHAGPRPDNSPPAGGRVQRGRRGAVRRPG